MASAAAGSVILPGFGTILGGLTGSIVGGSFAGKAVDGTIGVFIEDDANEMVKIIENIFADMASDYLLSQKEAEKSVDRLKDKLDGEKLKDMFASSDRYKFAKDMLTPIIENETAKREIILAISPVDMTNSLRMVLEEISDNLRVEDNQIMS